MDNGVVGTGGTIAEVPKQVVVVQADFGSEGDRVKGAVANGVLRLDDDIVDDERGGEVGSLRSHQIGVTSITAKAINMSIEAVWTGDMVYVVTDSLPDETVFLIAAYSLKLVGGNGSVVEEHIVDVLSGNYDIDVLVVNGRIMLCVA